MRYIECGLFPHIVDQFPQFKSVVYNNNTLATSNLIKIQLRGTLLASRNIAF